MVPKVLYKKRSFSRYLERCRYLILIGFVNIQCSNFFIDNFNLQKDIFWGCIYIVNKFIVHCLIPVYKLTVKEKAMILDLKLD